MLYKPVAIFLPLMLLVACGQTPTGREQLLLVPESMMDDMGRTAFEDLKQTAKLSSDPDNQALVECIALNIIAASEAAYPAATRPGDWEVVVFNDPTPNAFAMPGKKIGVHTGLISISDNPDQLASVIGHEVGHVLSNHGNERMTQQLGVSAILLLIGVFAEIDSQLLMQVLGMGAQVGVILPFSRAHESEADSIGLNLMAAAGFDPAQSVELWRNMAKASGGNAPAEFLSTHPGHETRISDLQDQLDAIQDRYANVADYQCPGLSRSSPRP